MLANLNQSDVDLMRDGRDLVGREQSFKYDLVFIRDAPEEGFCAVNLVRYLTRGNLVPKWCKFIIISDEPDTITGAPVFRHLRTEILPFPYNYSMLENSVEATIQSLKVFQKLLKNLNHFSPSVLIKSIRNIDPGKFDATHKDELLQLKIKLFLQGRRPDLAWNLTEKICLPSDRIREQLFISFYTGQEHQFLETLDMAQGCDIMKRGCLYYQTYYSLFRNQPELALRYFEQLPENELLPNEMETHALLLLKVQGLTKAIEYLNAKDCNNSEDFDLKNNLSLIQLSCYTNALMSGNLGDNSAANIYKEMAELIKNNTWSKGSFRYNMYKPFVLLVMATLQGKKLYRNFEKLFELRLQLDVKQLNMLLFVAHKLGVKNESIDIHKMLERNAARLEMSPELITHEMCHREVIKDTLSKAEQRERYLLIADMHRDSGRLYRALRKYYISHKYFGSSDNTKLKMLEILTELGLKSYWDFKSIQMLDGMQTNKLSVDQQALVQKLQKSA